MIFAFYFFSLLTLMSACQVVLCRHPVHSVLSLIFCFFTSAGLFLILGAEFLAMVMVIVYVGAVAILFLFVVMMLEFNEETLKHYGWPGFRTLAGNFIHTLFLSLSWACLMGGILFIGRWLNINPWSSIILATCVSTLSIMFLWPYIVGSHPLDVLKAFCRLMPLSLMGASFCFGLLLLFVLWYDSPLLFDTYPLLAAAEDQTNAHQLGSLIYTVYVIPFQCLGLILLVAMIGAICLCLRNRSNIKRQNVFYQLAITKEDVLDIQKDKESSWTSR